MSFHNNNFDTLLLADVLPWLWLTQNIGIDITYIPHITLVKVDKSHEAQCQLVSKLVIIDLESLLLLCAALL